MIKNKTIRIHAYTFLVGVTIGGLAGISIKYPVSSTVLDEASKLCSDTNFGIQKMRIGISGKLYYLKCNSQKIYTFK